MKSGRGDPRIHPTNQKQVRENGKWHSPSFDLVLWEKEEEEVDEEEVEEEREKFMWSQLGMYERTECLDMCLCVRVCLYAHVFVTPLSKHSHLFRCNL